MNKKKDSIFTEPYQLAKLVCEAAMLVVASVRSAVVGASHASKEETVTSEEAKLGYEKMQADLKTPETVQAWKRYLVTGMAIQGFLVVLTLLHAILGNYLIVLSLLVLTGASVVLFGYRPWILRNKALIPFMMYVKKISKDPGCLMLWNSLNVLD